MTSPDRSRVHHQPHHSDEENRDLKGNMIDVEIQSGLYNGVTAGAMLSYLGPGFLDSGEMRRVEATLEVYSRFPPNTYVNSYLWEAVLAVQNVVASPAFIH